MKILDAAGLRPRPSSWPRTWPLVAEERGPSWPTFFVVVVIFLRRILRHWSGAKQTYHRRGRGTRRDTPYRAATRYVAPPLEPVWLVGGPRGRFWTVLD